jgi:ribosome-associated protein
MLRINDKIAIPLREFRWEFARSGGPGGQNVNKVNSKAVLRWRPADCQSLPAGVRDRLLASVSPRLTSLGELLVSSELTRDQGRNIADCLEKVRRLVTAALVPPRPRRPTRPTRSSQVRRLESKRQRTVTKKLRRGPESD